MSKSSVTQEEKQFIAAQFVPPQCYDDCVVCGRQIDSVRQNEFPDADTCGRKSCEGGE